MADDDDLRPQRGDEDVLDEALGAPGGELAREPHDEHGVQPGALQQVEAVVEPGQQPGGPVGVEDLQRVRVEGDGDRPETARAGEVGDPSQDGGVTAVDPVEVADGDDRPAEPGFDV